MLASGVDLGLSARCVRVRWVVRPQWLVAVAFCRLLPVVMSLGLTQVVRG